MNVLRQLRFGLFIIISLVVATTAGIGTAAPLEKSSTKEIQLAGAKAQGKLTVRASESEISVAESLTLTIEVTAPPGAKAQLPSFTELGFATDFTERSQRFRLTNVSAISQEKLSDGSTFLRQIYTLEPWLSGDYAILPIMVPFYEDHSQEDNKTPANLTLRVPLFSLMTDGMRLKVKPLADDRRQLSPLFGQADLNQNKLLNKERRLEDKSDEELHREKEQQSETAKALQEKHFPWWILWLLLALMVLLPAGWYLSRKKGRTFFKKKETPPHIKAALAFAALKKEGLLQKGEIKEFYYELSFILREYIGGRFQIFAQHQTSEEFFQELLQNNPFDSMAEQILRDFSDKSDTVKYSLFRPNIMQAEDSLSIARSFVDNTTEKDPSKADKHSK